MPPGCSPRRRPSKRGGRKRKIARTPEIIDDFRAVLHEHTAGSPVDPEVIRTDLNATDIAEKITERGHPVSVHIAEQLLDEYHYRHRTPRKDLPMREHKDREEQFGRIAEITEDYLDRGEPIISMDTKKREMIGNFQRQGELLSRETIRAFDHDFPSFADGVVIPHGIYDVRLNRGYLHLGTSHDTSEFACENLSNWWERFGRVEYPRAKSVLLKCDGGGSNSARTYLFKADLQKVADETGLEIRVCHYPPYCSKYNPIEHRLFCHVSRACRGVIFTSMDLVKELMGKTRTRTGLSVVVDVVEKVYHKGRKIAEAVKESLNLIRDEALPQLNYRILPRPARK